MTNKVEIKHLTKIFGKRPKAALKMVKQNKSKNEIVEKTGSTVGVYDINMTIEEGGNLRDYGPFRFWKVNLDSFAQSID